MPRISPGRASNDTSEKLPARLSPSTSSTGVAVDGGRKHDAALIALGKRLGVAADHQLNQVMLGQSLHSVASPLCGSS